MAVPPLQTTQCGVVRKSVHLFLCVCGCGKHVVGQSKTVNRRGMKCRTESKTRVNPESKASDNCDQGTVCCHITQNILLLKVNSYYYY